MNVKVLPGEPPIEVNLRRSARARRITLRVSGIDNKVTVTMPKAATDRQAMAFVHEKEPWVRGHLKDRGGMIKVGIGARLPFEGQMLHLVPGEGARLLRVGDSLHVPGRSEDAAGRVLGYVKHVARGRCIAAADHYAARLGQSYTGFSLRDTRSRWGSCTSEGRIMLSWRLIMAPPEVLDYVVAHEVAHLQEMNHSAAFWDLVADIYGPYARPRTWLRENGADLHRYRFSD